MTEVQRWIGFASFMGMTLIGWCLALFVLHPISGAPVIGYFVGVVSLIVGLGTFEKRESTTVDKQPEKAHNTHSTTEEENLNV